MTQSRTTPAWLLTALDYGPIILFFAAFMLFRGSGVEIGGQTYDGVLMATIVLVPVTILAALTSYILTRSLSAPQAITVLVVVVFGGLSIWLNDKAFIKMKPTLIYLSFAALLGISLSRRRNWVRKLMGGAVDLDEVGWRRFEKRCLVLCLVLAVLNELVWRMMPDTFWFLFKTFGLPVIFTVFILANYNLFRKHENRDQTRPN